MPRWPSRSFGAGVADSRAGRGRLGHRAAPAAGASARASRCSRRAPGRRRQPRPGEREPARPATSLAAESDGRRRRRAARAARAPDGRVLVANYRGGEVVAVDPSGAAIVARGPVCAGAYGLAAAPDGSWVAVSCEWDGTVRKLDPRRSPLRSVARRAPPARGRSRGRVAAPTSSSPTTSAASSTHPRRTGRTPRARSCRRAAPYRPALTTMSANLASAIVPRSAASTSRTSSRTTPGTRPRRSPTTTASVTSTNPKINPARHDARRRSPGALRRVRRREPRLQRAVALAAFGRALPARRPRLDGERRGDRLDARPAPARARSGPSRRLRAARASRSTRPHTSPSSTTRSTARSRASISPSRSPTAPAIRAEVDARAPAPLPLLAGRARRAPALLRRDQRARHAVGRRRVRELPPRAGATTGSSGSSRRRTSRSAAAARRTSRTRRRRRRRSTGTDSFATMSDLVESTMTNLMGGDGLLVDVNTVQAYIDEIVQAPVLPADGRGRGRARQGALRSADGRVRQRATRDVPDRRQAAHRARPDEPRSRTTIVPMRTRPACTASSCAAPYFHDGRATQPARPAHAPRRGAHGPRQGADGATSSTT